MSFMLHDTKVTDYLWASFNERIRYITALYIYIWCITTDNNCRFSRLTPSGVGGSRNENLPTPRRWQAPATGARILSKRFPFIDFRCHSWRRCYIRVAYKLHAHFLLYSNEKEYQQNYCRLTVSPLYPYPKLRVAISCVPSWV